MKRTIITLAALALSIGAANAGCTTSKLAGTWTVLASDTWCSSTVSSTGSVSGTCGAGKISVTPACKLTGTMAGAKVTGRTDSNGNIFIMKMSNFLATGYKN